VVKTWSAKDPDEVLDYTYDWSVDLDLANGETLLPTAVPPEDGSQFIVVTASGTSLVGDPAYGPDFVTVVLEGGTLGEEAIFTTRVKTTAGRILEDTIILPIRSTVVPVPHPGGYVDPTPANLLCLFAEFASVPEPTIRAYLERAKGSVDTSWSEADFAHARMLHAAHMMTVYGRGSTAEAAAIADGSGEFRTMAIGPLRLERFDKGSAAKSGAGWDQTRYGREFKLLLRKNRGGPRVAGFGTGQAGDGDRSQFPTYPWNI
jgi:hypothetical protein